MQFPNTLLQNFSKSYSSLESSGLLNNIFRLCYTNLSFTPTPQHCIILTDIGSPTYPVHLLSATLQAPSTFEEVLPSEYLFHFGNNYNTCTWVTAVFIVFENFICAYFHHIALEIMSLLTCILILMYLLNFEKAVDQVFKLHQGSYLSITYLTNF